MRKSVALMITERWFGLLYGGNDAFNMLVPRSLGDTQPTLTRAAVSR